jgi:SAM-dependent methyltransferase
VKPEEIVERFYEEAGWKTENGVTGDAGKFENLRESARRYVTACRLRVLRHIPPRGEHFLDMASGPLQYDEYLDYSRGYAKRHCVDLSARAIEGARRRIGDHGVFHHGNFLDLPFEDDFFDCTVSLHTIYHIDGDRQAEAVRKLLRVTKPGRPVIIVYSNPDALYHRIRKSRTTGVLYFKAHPHEWWDQFRDEAEVKLFPWRSFSAPLEKKLIPDHFLGRIAFRILFGLEELFPRLFVRFGQYPMVVLTRRSAESPTR